MPKKKKNAKSLKEGDAGQEGIGGAAGAADAVVAESIEGGTEQHGTRTILSFDIGIRHLAYCILKHRPCISNKDTAEPPHQAEYAILDWRVVDLLAVRGTPYDLNMVYVESKTWKVAQLRKWLVERDLPPDGGRAALVEAVHKALKAQGIRKRSSNDVAVLAAKLFAFLDSQPHLLDCDSVVFENQPCLVNPVMKSVQIMLYSFFVYHGVTKRHQAGDRPIMGVAMKSATNKLKKTVVAGAGDGEGAGDGDGAGDGVADGASDAAEANNGKKKSSSKPVSAYRARKLQAIQDAQTLLTKWPDTAEWQKLFEGSCMKEKDDLSDCLLQGLYTLQNTKR